ncbi:MAG: AbrB/MazE/SpoVT family DNA-binding domain-containing protein [Candidatus Peregrinibacteria bacterium]
MKTTIRSWGNSLAVRIPKAYAVHLGIISGKEVELSMELGALRISSLDQKLESLLEKVTAENLHGETDTGAPIGKEIW